VPASDAHLILLAPAVREQRRVARRRVHVAAQLRASSVGRIAVTITDISALGCQVRARQHFGPGTYLLVQVPSFEPFGATVVWAEDGLIGFEFVNPLHPAVVEHIIDMSTLDRQTH
jgi:hypothetical protein